MSETTLSDAALIVTFYLESNDAYRMICTHLQKHLQLNLVPERGYWHNETTRTRLWEIQLPRPHNQDTWAVELTLDSPRDAPALDAPSAWDEQRARLERGLDETRMRVMGIRGYRLVYEARTSTPSMLPKDAHQARRLLHTPEGSPLPVLAEESLEGGHLWLLHVPAVAPLPINERATVYVALAPDDRLVRQVILRNGSLMLADLVAHKGYHQMRHYNDPKDAKRYSTHVEQLREAIKHVLDQPAEEIEQNASALQELATRYDRLIEDVLIFAGLRVSLAQQVENYRLWQQQVGGGAVFEYHARRVSIGLREVELLLAKGQNALDITATTVQVQRTQLQKVYEARRQEQEQRLNTTLAMVGLVLGLLQVLLAIAAILEGTWQIVIIAVCGIIIVVVGGIWWWWKQR